MESAALVLLATGLGVGFSWTPTAGDSTSCECVIHVDPQTFAQLAAGQPMPIVWEPPPAAGPVRRVRIALSRQGIPPTRRETRLKPIADDAVWPAQYGAPYASHPGQSPATAASPNIPFDPYAKAPSPTSASQRYGNIGSATNVAPPAMPAQSPLAGPAGGTVAQYDNLARPGTSALPAASARQSDLRTIAPPNSPPLSRQSATPYASGAAANNGNHLVTPPPYGGVYSGATQPMASTGSGARQSVNDGAQGTSYSPSASTGSGNFQSLNNGAGAPHYPRSLGNASAGGVPSDGRYTQPGNQYNGQDQFAGDPYGASNRPPLSQFGTGSSSASQMVAPPGDSSQRSIPGNANNADRWTSNSTGSPNSIGSTQYGFGQGNTQGGTPAPSGGGWFSGDQYGQRVALQAGGNAGGPVIPDPNEPSQEVASGRTDGDFAPFASPGQDRPLNAAPSVNSSMLRQPADAQLQGGYVVTTPVGDLITPTSANDNDSTTASAADSTGASPEQNTASNSQQNASPIDGKRQASGGAVLAAWVLLAGSVAGNLYLFWSYLDVRARFQSMNRQNVRAPSSRFSAA